MWLLSADRAILCEFLCPEAVTGGYAILSHTWGDDEETFQTIKTLNEECKQSGKNPRSHVSSKVRNSCILAERYGYRYIWNDTCCIDKTNSSELAEAIKSMFHWYSRAEVCFAYLGDVRSADRHALHAPGSAFRTARWHSRGWTLQELIAPSRVLFVSKYWEVIGDKSQLSSLLEEVTGVSSKVLTFQASYSDASIAERMTWAAERSTSRPEDEAYCLMGLFDVDMPTIYGEGRRAFQRLQQEIMKRSSDTSLFAWGSWIRSENIAPVGEEEMHQRFTTPSQNRVYLLAPSPKSFSTPFGGRLVQYTLPERSILPPHRKQKPSKQHPNHSLRLRRHSGPFQGHSKLPRFSTTAYGVMCHFPIIEVDGLTIVVLLCDNGHEHIGLLLHPANDHLHDPSREKYYTGYFFHLPTGPYFRRLISLGNDLYNLRVNGKVVRARWRDVFIAETLPPPMNKAIAPAILSALESITPLPPFRLPNWLIGRLSMMGMELQPPGSTSTSERSGGNTLPMSIEFVDMTEMEGVRLIFGTCEQRGRRSLHWAKAMSLSSANWHGSWSYEHVCARHHVEDWPSLSKDFGDGKRTVRLSFLPASEGHSTATLIIHIQLEGRIYTGMKRRKDVDLPSPKHIGRA